MDQGMAALAAGVCGSIGAIGGAVAGAWIGKSNAMQAVKAQVRGQAETEHRHWVRDHRKVALIDALDLVGKIDTGISRAGHRLETGREIPSEQLDQLEAEIEAFLRVVFHLGVWGPDGARRTGQELHRLVTLRSAALIRWEQAVVMVRIRQTIRKIFEFAATSCSVH